MDKIKNNMKNDIFSIVRKISPYIPALVISQVLPSKTTQKHEEDPTHNLINFLLDKKIFSFDSSFYFWLIFSLDERFNNR